MAVSVPMPGELNRRIQIFSRTDLPNADDGESAVGTDALLWQCWAKCEPIGSAYWNGVQTEEKATHRFWVRQVKDKTDPQSLSHGVLIQMAKSSFRITRVTDLNDGGRWTLIEAMELGADRPENTEPVYYV